MSTDKTDETDETEDKDITAAFGAKNRDQLLGEYLDIQPPLTAETAWEHVYRLLMWIDQTTGLAHCYESDKCQPGKPWYGRSLAFHGWVASALRTTPTELASNVDWLFKKATADLAATVVRRAASLEAHGAMQRKPYQAFPQPGEDPELVSIVKEVLGEHFFSQPTEEQWKILVQRIRKHVAAENKRKNLVGEGFEDVLAILIKRIPATSSLDVRVRKALQDIQGFGPPKKNDKPNKVDLAILRTKRTLVTVKWSLRADRERQFPTDYSDAVGAETASQPWEYVFVTNEFDPARLMRACEKLAGSHHLFTHVVHINTQALKATYAVPEPEPEPTPAKRKKRASSPRSRDSIDKVLGYIESGRLISLGEWLALLAT